MKNKLSFFIDVFTDSAQNIEVAIHVCILYFGWNSCHFIKAQNINVDINKKNL